MLVLATSETMSPSKLTSTLVVVPSTCFCNYYILSAPRISLKYVLPRTINQPSNQQTSFPLGIRTRYSEHIQHTSCLVVYSKTKASRQSVYAECNHFLRELY